VKRARRAGIIAVLGVAAALLVVGCGGGAGGGQGGGGEEGPTAKIVSDLPMQGANRAQTTTMVNAIRLALEQRDGKAGDVTIEYEVLDDATAQAFQFRLCGRGNPHPQRGRARHDQPGEHLHRPDQRGR
jgi:branched-chain amino acid transport system substrate-binding protein